MEKDLRFKILSEGLQNGVSITCRKYNISRTLYYRWLKRYQATGIEGLNDKVKHFIPINKTPEEIESIVLRLIKEYPHYGPRALKYLLDEVGHPISESAVFNILKRYSLTQKAQRIKFSKQNDQKTSIPLPPLSNLTSGQCWLFWTTDYGYFETIGHVYAYTFFDLKSRIACTRLYHDISFSNFEDLLSAVAIPVAKSLHLKIDYLCFLKTATLLNHSRKHFKSNIQKVMANHDLDFKLHILLASNSDFETINTLKNNYTKTCLSFLMPHLQAGMPFAELKLNFQDYLRDYNFKDQFTIDGERYSPIAYHSKLTNTEVILPIWAYIDRIY